MTLALPSSAALATPVSPTAAVPTDRAKLSAAARQFEAIFVRQMLAAARKSDLGGDALFGSQGLDTFRQMQDERFAEIVAGRGTFGIAQMIEAQLARQAPEQEA